ncbi:MAG TPA: glycosyltransferase family 2 protein [Verrucomicrobiae bacterium]
MQVALTILWYAAAILYSVASLRALVYMRWVKRLPRTHNSVALPKVSIIFAARDEAERIETTIRRLLALSGIEFEIIPVDDRSRDETSQILKRLSAEDSRVRPKRVDVLPEDWLGKCHACHLGAQSATGEWLLFTDADCWMKSDTLTRALTVAQTERVQHITMTPGVSPNTLAAEGWHLAFLVTVVDWIARTNSDHPRGHLGVGAFNLVHRDTYQKFGGHETLRLTVVDDVKLGRLVRKAGARTRAFIGGDDVECHWGVSVRQIIKIMEKNYFAALDYNVAFAVVTGPVMMVLWAAAILGLFSGQFVGTAAGIALLSLILPATLLARLLNWKIRGALFAPFAFVALNYAILRSTYVTLRQGGVKWRDTFYPLHKLRAGNVY